MRIIAEPPHPHFKITVFKNGLKYSLQIEGKASQIIYKLPEIPAFDSNEKVLAAMDHKFIPLAIASLENQEKTLRNALSEYDEDEYFEEII